MTKGAKSLRIRLHPEDWIKIERIAKLNIAPYSSLDYDERTMKFFRPYLMKNIRELSEAVHQEIEDGSPSKKQDRLFIIPEELVGPIEILAKQRSTCFSKIVDRFILFPLLKQHFDDNGF